jgi:hypothetical protein
MCVGKTPASLRNLSASAFAKNEVLNHGIAAINETRNTFFLIAACSVQMQLPGNMQIAGVMIEHNAFGEGKLANAKIREKNSFCLSMIFIRPTSMIWKFF